MTSPKAQTEAFIASASPEQLTELLRHLVDTSMEAAILAYQFAVRTVADTEVEEPPAPPTADELAALDAAFDEYKLAGGPMSRELWSADQRLLFTSLTTWCLLHGVPCDERTRLL